MEDTFLINTPFNSIKVHPVVPFTILELYNRRANNNDNIIGTIMGTIINGVLEITNCYTVNYTFDDDDITSEQKAFNDNLAKLYSVSSKSDQIVGWFSTVTSPVVAEKKWHILNNYYRDICQLFKPIFLTIDVSFEGEKIGIDAYSVTSVVLNGTVLAIKLTNIPVETTASAVENQVIASMNYIQNSIVPNSSGEVYNDLERLKAEMEDLMNTLIETEEYINKVIKEEIKPTPEQSSQVFNAITSVPMIPKEEFMKMFNEKLQDFALVSSLSTMAAKQVELAEKMNDLFKPRS